MSNRHDNGIKIHGFQDSQTGVAQSRAISFIVLYASSCSLVAWSWTVGVHPGEEKRRESGYKGVFMQVKIREDSGRLGKYEGCME